MCKYTNPLKNQLIDVYILKKSVQTSFLTYLINFDLNLFEISLKLCKIFTRIERNRKFLKTSFLR